MRLSSRKINIAQSKDKYCTVGLYSIKREGKCSWILVVEAGVLAVEQRVVALAVQGVEAVGPWGGGGGLASLPGVGPPRPQRCG